MPESSLGDVSSSQVLYSCQYDQQLYRQHVLQRHLTLPSHSNQLGHNSRSLLEFRRDLGSCRYVETLSPAENGTEHIARYRKVRQHKYRTTSHLHLRSLRYSQRHSFMTSDHNRRKRFPTIAQRKAANVREQKRMYNLKEAFKSLRECLPTFSYEKKMSRIETLRLSITYIGFLKKLLNDCDQNPLSQISQNQSNTGREC